MGGKMEMCRVGVFILCSFLFGQVTYAKEKAESVHLTEENWKDMLEGEWLVKFYAPWCPACKSLVPVWEKVASWSDDIEITVADVDVTESPGLSGRFFVTALPTIYHVKDGEFRLYRGSRSEDDLVSFVDDNKWKQLDPVPWYTSPKSFHMGILSWFFKASMAIRDLHNSMTTEFGIPVWGSYVIFALATILAGLLLGLIVVCLCDAVFPPRPQPEPSKYDKPYYTHVPNHIPNSEDVQDNESDIIEDDMQDQPVEPHRGEVEEDVKVEEELREEKEVEKGEADQPSSGARKRVVKATTD